MALKLEWGSQDMAGNFTSFAKERRQKANKAPGSRGPRSRGGKRVPTDVSEERLFRATVAKQPNSRTATAKPKPATAKVSPARAKGAGLAPVKRTGTTTVGDVKNTVSATSAPLKKNKAMQVGGLFGRTASGEFYLGRKKGKG